MTKSIDVSGKSEDEAIEAALEQLGLTRDDVSVEIIEWAKSGFLGFKSTPAVVRVTYDDKDERAERPIRADREERADRHNRTSHSEHADAGDHADRADHTDRSERPNRPGKPDRAARHERPAESDSATQQESQDLSDSKNRVESFLKGLLLRMDIDAEIEAKEGDGSIDVILTSKDPGALIGRRGETLDAIQHLANYVINRGGSGRTRINIDAENYRQRRNETLEALAARVAGKVIKYRRNVTMEPMNAYERHVIHSTLQDYEGISTYSVGSEPNRRIVVAYSRNAEGGGRGGDYNSRGGDYGSRGGDRGGRSHDGDRRGGSASGNRGSNDGGNRGSHHGNSAGIGSNNDETRNDEDNKPMYDDSEHGNADSESNERNENAPKQEAPKFREWR